MMVIATMAQSAAQTPKRSTTRDNPWGRLIDCPDGWFVRGARWAIGKRYRKGLKKLVSDYSEDPEFDEPG